MPRKKNEKDDNLKHRLYTRVNEAKFNELQAILKKNPQNDMSRLIRDILHNRRVKVFVHDTTMDDTMEALIRLRREINSIGVNINQITHRFNSYPDAARKVVFARLAFQEYTDLQPKIDEMLVIVRELGKKWLSE